MLNKPQEPEDIMCMSTEEYEAEGLKLQEALSSGLCSGCVATILLLALAQHSVKCSLETEDPSKHLSKCQQQFAKTFTSFSLDLLSKKGN